MRRRGNISLKLVAQMLVKAGFKHIITVDLHSKESQGFFDCAIDNLRASPFLIQYIQDSVSTNHICPTLASSSDAKDCRRSKSTLFYLKKTMVTRKQN